MKCVNRSVSSWALLIVLAISSAAQQPASAAFYNGISWSPDGTKRAEDTQPTLYTVKPDGTDVQRFEAVKSSLARFSPDGSRLAYIFGQFPRSAIHIANADGTNALELKLN